MSEFGGGEQRFQVERGKRGLEKRVERSGHPARAGDADDERVDGRVLERREEVGGERRGEGQAGRVGRMEHVLPFGAWIAAPGTLLARDAPLRCREELPTDSGDLRVLETADSQPAATAHFLHLDDFCKNKKIHTFNLRS